MIIRTNIFCTAVLIITLTVITAAAGDWPDWHGPDRTNKSKETGLLKQWPKEGPALLWTAKGLGDGYSTVSTFGGTIYTAGVVDNMNYVFAFDLGGKLLWRTPAGGVWEATRAFARAYRGSRATPVVNDGMVYYLSDTGLLVALDAKTGAQRWSLNIREKYNAAMPEYGYSESPLIVGRLYVAAYGKKAGALCLDKKTGKVIWESAPKATTANRGDPAYTSFIWAENSGYRQLISFSSTHVYGIDSETGRYLWTVPMHNSRDNNCADVIFHDGHVFASTGYGIGSKLIKLEPKGKSDVSATVVYETKLMDNHHGGLVLHEGHVYGAGHESAGWFCLDFKTGQQKWRQAGKGSMTFADGMLYMYDEKGTMSLVKATPSAFTPVSSFEVPSGNMKSHFWARPVVSNGVLYVRYADHLYAYDIKAK